MVQKKKWLPVLAAAGMMAVACFATGTLSIARECVSDYQMFSYADVQTAEYVEENTPEHSTFICWTQHINPVSALAGRNIVCGPALWLSFHGYDLRPRESDIRAFYADPEANEEVLNRYNVDYILIGEYETSSLTINEDAIAFTERFSTYAAILEKKMMIYDKFTLMVEQRNVRGEPITEQELEQFERALSEVDLQYKDQKKLIRPQYTTWNLYKKSFNPEFYKFMSINVDKTYSAVRNKIDNEPNPTIISRLTSFFKRQFNDISTYLKNTSAAMSELKEIGKNRHIPKDTTNYEKLAETMYILNELDRIDINNAKLRNEVNQIRIQADRLDRMGIEYNDPDLLAQAENLRDRARIAQREANYYNRNSYNNFYNY